MLSRCQLAFTRGMRTSAVKRTTNSKLPADQVAQELEKIPTPEKFKVGPLEEVPKFPSMPKYKLRAYEKMFVVWSGHYKSFKDVPPRVDNDIIHKARTYARIRINLGLLGFGVFMCFFMAYLGKQAASRGEYVEVMNLEWHKKINEDYAREQAAKADQK